MRLLPVEASTIAPHVDRLFLFLVVTSAVIVLAILAAQITFAIKYRRRPGNELSRPVRGTNKIEIGWTVAALVLSMVPFVWGANLYLALAQPPDDSLDVYVVARQWMWKVQHSGGQAEIDELHVPVGRPVRLTMISQDVIHSFYVPDFRIKQDVLPSRYTTVWFEATQPGTYRLNCAEYCGVDHSRMGGSVIAMAPADFATWLQQGSSLSTAGAGRRLFQQYGCATCHEGNRAPNLAGVYGQPVLLRGGQTVVADDNYVRESILRPSAKVVEGYDPIMPSFSGLLTEDEVLQLVAYVRSIGAPAGRPPERPRLLPVPRAQGGPQP